MDHFNHVAPKAKYSAIDTITPDENAARALVKKLFAQCHHSKSAKKRSQNHPKGHTPQVNSRQPTDIIDHLQNIFRELNSFLEQQQKRRGSKKAPPAAVPTATNKHATKPTNTGLPSRHRKGESNGP